MSSQDTTESITDKTNHPVPHRWLIFLVVATGVFMSTLDSSMVNIALPSMMRSFGATLQGTEWVVLIYLLTITATLLFWGHLADRLGRDKIYSRGMLIFAISSLACAKASSLELLIAARLLQAIGAAMMMATGPAIIKETFPPALLGRSLGLIGVAVSLGLMSGPALGGIIIEFYSWRGLFLITVPVGIIFTILGNRYLPHHQTHNGRIDWYGALTWAVALILLALTLTHATATSWSSSILLILLAASIVALTIFLKIETIASHPLLPLFLFRRSHFSMGVTSAVLSFITLFTVIMLTPFYLDRILGLSGSRIGLIMMSVPITIMVIAPLAGWLSDHTSDRLLPTLGLFISSSGLLLLAQLTATSSFVEICLKLAMVGAGQAMFLSPNSAAVLSKTAKDQVGAATALLATARNLGMLLGVGQAGLIFSLLFSRYSGGLDLKDFTPGNSEHFIAAIQGAFLAAAIVGAFGTTASWLRGKGSRNMQG